MPYREDIGKCSIAGVAMPCHTLSQQSFFDPEFVMPGCLKKGSVPWMLARYRSRLFPQWIFQGWRGEGRLGRNAWPAVVLMTLLLLRWSEEGISRMGSTRRGETDICWRAAMGLHLRRRAPRESTLREFEAFLAQRHPAAGVSRLTLLHEHVVRLCQEEGLTAGHAPAWAMDSTPTWCYGAVKDTVRLLGDGLGMLAGRWAKATKESLEDIAAAWDVPFILGKSVKGALGIDWRDADSRANAMDTLAQGVIRAVRWVRSRLDNVARSKHKRLLRTCRHLLRVISENLEADDKGRLVVAEKVAKDRLISLTDPQARHGRKSKKSLFNGYKTHLLGDLVSGLITAVTVTVGNAHDSSVAHRLVKRAKKLCDDIERVLGDTAYGAAELHSVVREDTGVSLLTPPPARASKPFGRETFQIDFEAKTATCPAGVTTGKHQTVWSKDHNSETSTFRWPKESCKSCSQRQDCLKSRQGGKYIRLHPHERELRQIREQWEDPEVRQEYRTRSQCERLVNECVRHGGRQARSFGLQAANRQALLIVVTCNLRLLARVLAEQA